MKNIIYTLGILCMAVLSSCTEGGDSLPAPTPIQSTSIPINEILKPGQWIVANGRAVLLSSGTDSLFFIYSLPDWKFLYSTGRYGEGPDDFGRNIFLVPRSNGDMGYFFIKDFRNKPLKKYTVGDKSMENTGSVSWGKSSRVSALTEILPCMDDKYHVSLSQHTGDTFMSIFIDSAQDGTPIDSIKTPTITDIESDNNGEVRYTRHIITGDIAVRGSRVALMYNTAGLYRVDFYDISPKGRLSHYKTTGDVIDEALINRIRAVRSSSVRRMGCIDSFTTDNRIYMLDIDFQAVKNEDGSTGAEFLGTWVRVYDWDGDLVGYYELDAPATGILAAGDDSCFFTQCSEEDFDHVHMYKID